MTQPKYKLGDHVRVNKGFYEGQTGHLFHYSPAGENYEMTLDDKFARRILVKESDIDLYAHT